MSTTINLGYFPEENVHMARCDLQSQQVIVISQGAPITCPLCNNRWHT